MTVRYRLKRLSLSHFSPRSDTIISLGPLGLAYEFYHAPSHKQASICGPEKKHVWVSNVYFLAMGEVTHMHFILKYDVPLGER